MYAEINESHHISHFHAYYQDQVAVYSIDSIEIISGTLPKCQQCLVEAWVEFDDNTEQIINFQPILTGELYRPLRDLTLFNQVRIDPEVHTLVWPNGADFDPATLHDWPKNIDALTERAQRWERTLA